MADDVKVVLSERERIEAEYLRRSREVDPTLYAPWQPAQMLMLAGRRRTAARLLREANIFPSRGLPVLEAGCGELGWMPDFVSWGLGEDNLHGIDLDSGRVARARESMPNADVRVGDAAELPWPDNAFQLAVASTLFSSILKSEVRQLVANEISRVVMPGGAVLWYDFVYNNPRNANVRRVGKRELKILFPEFKMKCASVTLAPPIARAIAPVNWALATLLEAIPILRTHLLAVLKKPGEVGAPDSVQVS